MCPTIQKYALTRSEYPASAIRLQRRKTVLYLFCSLQLSMIITSCATYEHAYYSITNHSISFSYNIIFNYHIIIFYFHSLKKFGKRKIEPNANCDFFLLVRTKCVTETKNCSSAPILCLPFSVVSSLRNNSHTEVFRCRLARNGVCIDDSCFFPHYYYYYYYEYLFVCIVRLVALQPPLPATSIPHSEALGVFSRPELN